MQAPGIRLGIYRNRFDTHPFTGSDDPDGNFAAIGNQYFLEHHNLSQGNIAVFAIRLSLFAFQELEGPDEPVPRVSGKNHVIDVPSFGCQKRVDKGFRYCSIFSVMVASGSLDSLISLR